MSLRETGIELDRVRILNRRFGVFAFLEITVATLQILLFANVGIARAGAKQGRDKEPNEKQAGDNGTAHAFSKAGAKARMITHW